MKSLLSTSLKKFLTLTAAAALSFSASAFDNIVIFGDSLSDTGNAKVFSGNPGIPERFSNGPVAVDFLTAAFGLQATPSLFLTGQELGNNYAVGGAIAIDADGDENTFDTNLPSQVNTYLGYNGFSADANTLYAVIIGGNDLFAAQGIRAQYVKSEPGAERQGIRQAARARVDEAVDSIEAQLEKLIAAGAQHIFVANAPDIGTVPNTDILVANLMATTENRPEERRAARMVPLSSRLTALFNKRLARTIERLERGSGLDIIEWDLASFLGNQIEDAEELGYTNIDDSCLADSQIPDCDGYIFFDGVHPTTLVHQRAGESILEILQ